MNSTPADSRAPRIAFTASGETERLCFSKSTIVDKPRDAAFAKRGCVQSNNARAARHWAGQKSTFSVDMAIRMRYGHAGQYLFAKGVSMPNPSVPAAAIGLSSDFGESLVHLEHHPKSLRSASATSSDRGQAQIERLKAHRASDGALEPISKPLEVFVRLNELIDFVACVERASRRMENRAEGEALSVALGHLIVGLRALSSDVYPPAPTSPPAAGG
jgi:hypothetical protein